MIKRRDFLLAGGSVVAGAVLGGFPARAHEYDIGAIKVEHPWMRAPADGDNKGQFYSFLHNSGSEPDKLIGVKCEKVGKVEIHGDAKNLTAITPIVIPPKSKLTLAPGDVYVALLDIKKHLEVGWGLEMTLVFEKAGEVVIDAAIEAPDAAHAHDGDAQARWEKAHNKDTSGPKEAAGHESHDHHHHHEEKHPEGAH